MGKYTTLEEIITAVRVVYVKTLELSKRVPKKHLDRFNALIPISNELLLSLEILEHYDERWWIESTNLLGQMGRIKSITSNAYISSFSITEFSIKEMIKYNNHGDFQKFIDKWNNGKFVNFISIINEFYRKKVISHKQRNDWDSHRKLRNCLVHNNAIGGETFEYKVNGRVIKVVKDQPIFDTLDLFIILIDKLIILNHTLVEKFHLLYS